MGMASQTSQTSLTSHTYLLRQKDCVLVAVVLARNHPDLYKSGGDEALDVGVEGNSRPDASLFHQPGAGNAHRPGGDNGPARKGVQAIVELFPLAAEEA